MVLYPMLSRFLFVAALAWGGAFLPTVSALTISGFVTEKNDRFANDGTFILNAFDLSGIGRSSDDRWGTLISNNVFISANHLHPTVSSTLTFHATDDSSGASITRTVASGQQISGTDLWVGVLDSPVSSSYKSYSFATTDIANSTDFGAWQYAGNVGAVFGRSPTAFSSVLDVAVGYNKLDGWIDDIELTGVTEDALLSLEGNANDVTYEALVQSGDSGAPFFVTANSELFLVGINWFIGTVDSDGTTYDTNGYTYLGNNDGDLNSVISANAVPEPGSYAALLGAGVLCFTITRRRRPLPA